jgi:ABC-type transporter Mla subunit MlaD
MQHGSGEGREIVNMEELTRAVTASETELTTADFAPPSNPQRIQRLAELTGASIRRTCADAGRAVVELVDQADAVVAQLRDDANGFVQSLDEIGNAHAARIERALTHLRGLVETISAERRRIVALADTHHTHREEHPQPPAEDLARENFPP